MLDKKQDKLICIKVVRVMQKFGYFIHLELSGYVSEGVELNLNSVNCDYVTHSALFQSPLTNMIFAVFQPV